MATAEKPEVCLAFGPSTYSADMFVSSAKWTTLSALGFEQ